MQRNTWVFVGGIALMVIFLFLMNTSLNFLWAFFIIGLGLLIYYEMTLTPEEKRRRAERRERQRLEQQRRDEERRHLEFVEKEARARARGEAYGSKIGYEKAKDDIAWERRPISTGFDTSPFMDAVLGRPASRRKKRR